MKLLRLVFFTLAGGLLRCVMHPSHRAFLLRRLGAQVGRGVRVHNCCWMNHQSGFSNLRLGDGVYIGPEVMLDLAAELAIGERTTISARAVLLSHTDPGASHGHPLAALYPPSRHGLRIGPDCWIGAAAVLLEAGDVGPRSLVAAGAVVLAPLPGGAIYAGVPARRVKPLPPALP